MCFITFPNITELHFFINIEFSSKITVLFVVHLIGKIGERIFDERDAHFTVGEGEELKP